MEGFEVTPRRPSSSISLLSSPVVIRLRRMKSSQTDWPKPIKAFSGFSDGLPSCDAAVGFAVVLIDKSPSITDFLSDLRRSWAGANGNHFRGLVLRAN